MLLPRHSLWPRTLKARKGAPAPVWRQRETEAINKQPPGIHGKAGPRGGASRSRAVRLIITKDCTHGDLGEVMGAASKSRHREEAMLTAGTRASKLQLGVTK